MRPKTLHVYLDGGARSNPGPAALGVVIYGPRRRVLARIAEYIGETTNNVAEYRAAMRGLEEAARLAGESMAGPGLVRLVIHSDSELLVRQMTGAYRIKDSKLLPLAIKLRELCRPFLSVTWESIPRAQNRAADALVNRAIDEALSSCATKITP